MITNSIPVGSGHHPSCRVAYCFRTVVQASLQAVRPRGCNCVCHRRIRGPLENRHSTIHACAGMCGAARTSQTRSWSLPGDPSTAREVRAGRWAFARSVRPQSSHPAKRGTVTNALYCCSWRAATHHGSHQYVASNSWHANSPSMADARSRAGQGPHSECHSPANES